MLAYIYVVGTPYFAKTAANGMGTLSDLPAGTYAVTVWHPDQKGGTPPEQQITLAPDARSELSLATDIKPGRKQGRPVRRTKALIDRGPGLGLSAENRSTRGDLTRCLKVFKRGWYCFSSRSLQWWKR